MTDTLARGAANQAGARVNQRAYEEAADFLPLNGIDHVEFWVGNARQSAHYFRVLWGFTPIAYAGLETGVRDRTSQVMRRNDITIVLTGALGPDGEIAEHVREHGDGVKDIAFAVDDATASYRETTKRGAKSAIEPIELDGGEDGVLRRSAVFTYGSVRHSFVDRSDYHGVFAPGFRKVKKPAPAAGGLSLLEIDHCVGNVALGDMNRFVDFYRDVFGFAQLIHYDDKVIHTEFSALMSKVMTNGNGRVKFPINEPASGKKKSQIQEFIDYYGEAGTQHIALRTEDIVGTVRGLRANGVEFLGMPTPTTSRCPTGSATWASRSRRSRSWASRPTATRRATSSRSSPGPSRTARRSSSRSSSGTGRAASASATSRRSSRRSRSSRPGVGTCSHQAWTPRTQRGPLRRRGVRQAVGRRHGRAGRQRQRLPGARRREGQTCCDAGAVVRDSRVEVAGRIRSGRDHGGLDDRLCFGDLVRRGRGEGLAHQGDDPSVDVEDPHPEPLRRALFVKPVLGARLPKHEAIVGTAGRDRRQLDVESRSREPGDGDVFGVETTQSSFAWIAATSSATELVSDIDPKSHEFTKTSGSFRNATATPTDIPEAFLPSGPPSAVG
jgi:4-hydroxyphenylpyruvate dioxygenase